MLRTILDQCPLVGVRLLKASSDLIDRGRVGAGFNIELRHSMALIKGADDEHVDFAIEAETFVKGMATDEEQVELFSISCTQLFSYNVTGEITSDDIEKEIDTFRHQLFLFSRSHISRVLSEMGINPQGLPYSLIQKENRETEDPASQAG